MKTWGEDIHPPAEERACRRNQPGNTISDSQPPEWGTVNVYCRSHPAGVLCFTAGQTTTLTKTTLPPFSPQLHRRSCSYSYSSLSLPPSPLHTVSFKSPSAQTRDVGLFMKGRRLAGCGGVGRTNPDLPRLKYWGLGNSGE